MLRTLLILAMTLPPKESQADVKAAAFLAVATLLGLVACDRSATPPPPAAAKSAAGEGYRPPPTLTGAAPVAGGVRLEGRAEPQAQVRLGEPTGGAFVARADAEGAWSLVLPASSETRIFGLSAIRDREARLQAQGYVFVTSGGEAVLLQAGGGAMRTAPGAPPRIAAADFDVEGGLVVSGVAPPDAQLSLRVDRRATGEARTDAQGRFVLAASQPVSPGPHQVEVLGDSVRTQTTITLTPAAPLEGRPYRAERTAEGLRVDWTTPGGGLQSTLLLD